MNAATLALLTHEPAEAAEIAGRVAEACAAIQAPQDERYWLFATEGEAALVRGRPHADGVPDAVDYYRDALAELAPDQGGMANSSYKQLCRVWKALGDAGDERVGPLLWLFETHPVARPSLTPNYLGRIIPAAT